MTVFYRQFPKFSNFFCDIKRLHKAYLQFIGILTSNVFSTSSINQNANPKHLFFDNQTVLRRNSIHSLIKNNIIQMCVSGNKILMENTFSYENRFDFFSSSVCFFPLFMLFNSKQIMCELKEKKIVK